MPTSAPVEITVDGFGDQSFTGQVERIAPGAASGTRMLPIFATIDNPEGELRGGMFASGRLVLEAKADVIGIPVEAIRKDDAGRDFQGLIDLLDSFWKVVQMPRGEA